MVGEGLTCDTKNGHYEFYNERLSLPASIEALKSSSFLLTSPEMVPSKSSRMEKGRGERTSVKGSSCLFCVLLLMFLYGFF